MAYKSKTKLRGRIMKQIRRRVSKVTKSPNTQLRQLRLLSMYQHTQFDTENAYMNSQETTNYKGQTLTQCMNSLQSKPPKRKRRSVKMKVRVAIQQSQPRREKSSFTPITIPGTPEEDINPQSPEISLPRTNTEEGIDEDLTIYYKVFNRHKPEFGESNAESAARTTAIEAEYRYLLMKKTKEKQIKKEREKSAKFHTLSPSTPPQETVAFKKAKESKPIRIESNKQRNKDTLCHNNVQEVTLQTDYSLYPTQEKPIQHQPINIIYDTGAAISMLPAEYTHAWTNVRECLHTLTGCFAGHSETNLMIGEFHGILTFDSQETIRIIVPECIQIPPGLSNTYLISNTAYLLAGHKYISHLSQPKLRFKGGGTYTMSVTKGHMLISVLPTYADKETTHRQVFMHEDEPYDPPTFVNNVLYNCTNRPNANTPTAFPWHLRYGCKCT
jgi:hypothetical protein